MKRVVFGLVAIIVLIVGNSVWHNSEHGGKNLFVKIQEDEKIEMKKSDNGHVTKYKYSVIGFDEKGKSQEIPKNPLFELEKA